MLRQRIIELEEQRWEPCGMSTKWAVLFYYW
jgi:hypothetical protein